MTDWILGAPFLDNMNKLNARWQIVGDPANILFSRGVMTTKKPAGGWGADFCSGFDGRTAKGIKYGYGTFEFKLKPRYVDGLICSVYAISGSYDVPNPNNNEIDVEFGWNGSNEVSFVTYKDHDQAGTGESSVFKTPWSDRWRVYGWRWYPNRVEFCVDGKIVRVHRAQVPSIPMYLFITTFGKKEAGGRMQVDYVAYDPYVG